MNGLTPIEWGEIKKDLAAKEAAIQQSEREALS
jgi:hypothetical protein